MVPLVYFRFTSKSCCFYLFRYLFTNCYISRAAFIIAENTYGPSKEMYETRKLFPFLGGCYSDLQSLITNRISTEKYTLKGKNGQFFLSCSLAPRYPYSTLFFGNMNLKIASSK